MTALLILFAGFCFVMAVVAAVQKENEKGRQAGMSPDERQRYLAGKGGALARQEHGALNPAMVCPHCGAHGAVRTKLVDRKKGVSGGKATAAVLTGGVSMLAVGLSRKEHLTRARCDRCLNVWEF